MIQEARSTPTVTNYETFIKFATVDQNLGVTIDCAKNSMFNPEFLLTLVKKLPQYVIIS
jgi:hypothetical protein